MVSAELTSVEICTGAGGQALGLEQAGFVHEALVEIEHPACQTLRLNRPGWNVLERDLLSWSGEDYKGVDLLAGGVPCPPFSKAGKQLGEEDERNLFPKAIDLVDEIRPKAVMFENVRGLLDSVFDSYRSDVEAQLRKLGYSGSWRLLNASNYGVSQLRPRVIFTALRNDYADNFVWPIPSEVKPLTVGELLYDLMAADGWEGASAWARGANAIAPTLVGGSKKHGGPDLGPTRARAAWAALGVNGKSLADEAPQPGFEGMPRLTVRMAARIQGFPDDWALFGRKTAAYRQVGNAFPPPVAAAVGQRISDALATRRLFAVA
ncbi:DNA cytosine methyltransferase [Clavibacter michiganensis]|uniref:Cytosine-specific methyltransferase n=1 Tax=Clavibacter michiganensis subsp. insidiosus TaxID=33014 RepID=A0A399SK37_9MICO|nr:DNA cytosine methyltransferase [Clavibacter michiganensis]OQJ61138.1 DNA (cytosine-5-)-methyltransferase [Clavibacter michiganensis subsp. insidiosus]RII86324.1 DNA cytosine methyltransferase [Clavibacter michiganensis subsp. insidiosus]RIJ43289.1 DNA cytosine methyltransferase [Clavibacter michiganensis subsp. insidiosus]RMC86193.1 DNA cytosine methyltransferase [Clavibacter michiganensis subsp. insidiosus]